LFFNALPNAAPVQSANSDRCDLSPDTQNVLDKTPVSRKAEDTLAASFDAYFHKTGDNYGTCSSRRTNAYQ
jgi:hypothetical protein